MKQLLPLVLAFAPIVGCRSRESATAPIHRLDQPNWSARHAQLKEQSPKGGFEVVFLGDSITHFWEGPGREIWDKNFGPLKTGNYGIAGDQTGHVLWRLGEGELAGIDPKVAVLLIGTNNLSAGHAPAEVAAGIAAVVGELRRLKPHTTVLVLGIFPRSANPSDRIRARIQETNALVARLADGERVVYKDIGARFLEEDGRLSEDMMPDNLHLGARGYEIWAEAIRTDLVRLLAPDNRKRTP